MKNTNNVDIASLLLQILNLEILFKDYNNRDLMNELQLQDEKYFKTIIKQNNEILKILNGKDDNNDSEN